MSVNEVLVQRGRDGVFVYENEVGDVIIKQQGAIKCTTVIVHMECVCDLIDALKTILSASGYGDA